MSQTIPDALACRCYYRCNFPDCPVRKQIEKHIDANGQVRKTAKMNGTHSHSDEVITTQAEGAHAHSQTLQAFRDSKCFDEDGDLEPCEVVEDKGSGQGRSFDPTQAQMAQAHFMQALLQSGSGKDDQAAASWQNASPPKTGYPFPPSFQLSASMMPSASANNPKVEETLMMGMKLGMQLPRHLNEEVLMMGIKMGMQMPKTTSNDAVMMGMKMGMQMILQMTGQSDPRMHQMNGQNGSATTSTMQHNVQQYT